LKTQYIPEKVAKLILKAAETEQPKYVYNINRSLPVRLLSFIPARILDSVLKKKLIAQNRKKF
jgi:hypothetical protein